MKTAWIEFDPCTGLAVRILGKSALCVKEMDRAEAVKQIREQPFSIQQGRCAGCNCLISWDTLQMHEKHRGAFKISPAAEALDVSSSLSIEKSGEISLENSVGLCSECHHDAHGDRQVKL